jgi:hypothetical protein
MAKTVKVAFEIDAEEVKKMIAAGKGKTTRLTPADVDKLGRDDVIKASDLLTRSIANSVATIFTKMQLYPDQSPTLITTVAKQFLFPKVMARMLVQQHVMYYAGMRAEERAAARRKA